MGGVTKIPNKEEEGILVHENLEAVLEGHSLPMCCSVKEPACQLKEMQEMQI